MLTMLGALLPRSVRRRQIHEWQDQLECTRATSGNPRRELIQLVRSAAPLAWTALPSFLRVSLPPLAVAMMATLLLGPPFEARVDNVGVASTNVLVDSPSMQFSDLARGERRPSCCYRRARGCWQASW
jgi:hypothetical protein